MRAVRVWTTLMCGLLLSAFVAAASPDDVAPLLPALRAGGLVLVMRHAPSPQALPNASEAEADNPQHERQLDAAGKADAQMLGDALRALHIPLKPIYSSPLYRAVETLRFAGLTATSTVPELAEGGNGMSASGSKAQAAWLKNAVNQPPPTGSNLLLVTHTPNIVAAFGQDVSDIQPGEMLVFRPVRGREAVLIARVKIDQWRQWAALH